MDEYNNEQNFETVNPEDVTVVENQPQANGLAIASLVVGIIAIVAGCCGVLGIVFGIAGIILALVSKSGAEKMSGIAVAGFVCSIIGLVLGIVGIVLYLVMGTAVGYQEILNSYN